MKTHNLYYENQQEFVKFVNDNMLQMQKNILIQVFCSIIQEHKLQSILKSILQILPHAKLIGATTDGEICNNVVSTDKIVLSITSFQHATLQVAFETNNDDSFLCGETLAKKIVQKNTQALILFSDGLHTNGELFLNGVKKISDDIVLAGGMAGDSAIFDTTYIFTNDGYLSNGAVGVSINSDALEVQSGYSFNWQEIGQELTITKVVENRVYEIDGLSAVSIYAKYLGQEIADTLPAVGIEFPLIITRGEMKIARAVLGKEEDGSLIFAGNLAVGDTVRFGYGHSGMILEESEHINKKFNITNIESIFIYSCMARRRFLEESIVTELTPFAKIAPTTGFFTYGEFYKATECELLNQTMTVLTLSENIQEQTYAFTDTSQIAKIADVSTTQKALSHLIQATSDELQSTNENLEKLVQEKTFALQSKVQELEEASKVKSDFLASMSHEIRTPLNAILGFVNILSAKEQDTQRCQQFEIIKSSGHSLLTIINDILDFSKIESGKMLLERRKFITQEPFEEVISLFHNQGQEKSIVLQTNFETTLPYFFVGDTVRIKQVVTNLLSNALKFTNKGGKIIISLSYDTQEELLSFCIEDDGVGIEAKNLKKIFEVFTQEDTSTTRKFGGTGLGLSISNALINAMGAELHVQSVINEGSSFSFSLPLLQANKPSALDSAQEIDYNQPLHGKILLVEDNKTNQMLITLMLKDLELDVTIAENGLEAVQKFKNEKYDLIFMDENMPKMNGIEATRIILDLELQHTIKHTPIIALTANALSSDRAKFLAAGMDEFIPKPIDNKLFIRILQYFLNS